MSEWRHLHELIGRRAELAPDDLAVDVIDGGRALTYSDLDGRSDAVAQALRHRGVGTGSIVAVHMPLSPDVLVVTIGILKAGAASMPVDPDYPTERIRALLATADPVVVVTTADLAASLAGVPGVGELVEVSELVRGGDHGVPPATVRVDADDAACVMFTSASTGPPKGVVLTHRGVANLALAGSEQFGLAPGDRFLQLSSISFSAFLEEVFPSLVSGATVVLGGYRAAVPSIPVLLDTLEQRGITAFGITTAHWHQMVEDLSDTGTRLPAAVRLVLMGCERALPERIAQWCELGVPMVHVYGPTETTATATYFWLDPDEGRRARLRSLPIGTAIRNAQVHLLDADMQPVPAGSVGEIYVGGDPLARGYLGRPAQTADRFVPDPFGPPGGRLYRTGDLGCLSPEGHIDFVGRIDNELKVHGCRIDPAEVERALEAHREVRSAVVLADSTPNDDKYLVAFVTLVPGSVLDVGELKVSVGQQLPRYMVPAVVVDVDDMPLTPHGKVDRRALLELVPSGADRATAPDEPVEEWDDPVEEGLADIWSGLLDVPRVRRDDDFFDLGGDSLMLIRVATRVRRRFGVNLDPEVLFATTSLADLARTITELADRSAVPSPVSVGGG